MSVYKAITKYLIAASFIVTFQISIAPSYAQQFDETALEIREKRREIKVSVRGNVARSYRGAIGFAEKGMFPVAHKALDDLSINGNATRKEFVYNLYRAKVFALEKKYDRAIPLYRANLRIAQIPLEEENDIVINLARLYHNNKNYEQAVIFTNRWLIYNEKPTTETHFILADSYFNLGELELAKYHFELSGSASGVPMRVQKPELHEKLENELLLTTGSQDNVSTIKAWLLEIVTAEQPRQARRREGTVTLNFDINAHGRPQNISIAQSSDPIFEEEALNAAGNLKYILFSKAQEDIYLRNQAYTFAFNDGL